MVQPEIDTRELRNDYQPRRPRSQGRIDRDPGLIGLDEQGILRRLVPVPEETEAVHPAAQIRSLRVSAPGHPLPGFEQLHLCTLRHVLPGRDIGNPVDERERQQRRLVENRLHQQTFFRQRLPALEHPGTEEERVPEHLVLQADLDPVPVGRREGSGRSGRAENHPSPPPCVGEERDDILRISDGTVLLAEDLRGQVCAVGLLESFPDPRLQDDRAVLLLLEQVVIVALDPEPVRTRPRYGEHHEAQGQGDAEAVPLPAPHLPDLLSRDVTTDEILHLLRIAVIEVAFQNADDLAQVLIAPPGFHVHRLADDPADDGRDFRIEPLRGPVPALLDREDGVRFEVPRKRGLAGHHFVEHHAHRVDVRALVHRPGVPDLLGRYVRRRPERHPLPGQTFLGELLRGGDSEIGELHIALP